MPGRLRFAATAPDEIEGLIRRSETARLDHRLHCVWLLARGTPYAVVAELMHEAPRTLACWSRRYKEHGTAGLREQKRPGRPRRLTQMQADEIAGVVRQSPRASARVRIDPPLLSKTDPGILI